MSTYIDAALNSAIRDGLVPGLVAAAGNRDEISYLKAFGSASAESNTQMQENSIFRIASMTKAITSVAVMQLVERQQIDLDAPASHYLPSLAGAWIFSGYDASTGSPRFRAPITAMTTRHLLTHTAGFGYEMWSSEILELVTAGHLPSMLGSDEHYGSAPLVFEPGSRWLYGINTDQLGVMIETVTGTRLDDYLQQMIFEPLGMEDTGFSLPTDKLSRLVSVSVPDAKGGYADADFPLPTPGSFLSGGGGLLSTASDYLRFTRMLLNKGNLDGVDVLRPDTVTTMCVNQIGSLSVDRLTSYNPMLSTDVEFFPGVRKTWGLGFLINEEQVPRARAAGSVGWAGIFNSYYWIDPTSGKTAVILMQVLPFFHEPCVQVLQRFEEALYAQTL
jgi:CubicO group peptidase (beta-lactamase class C family)